MKSNTIKIAAVAASCLVAVTSANAFDQGKVNVKPNMILEYKELPKPVNTIREAFTEGMVYGRLRANFFEWDWKDQAAGLDNKANGLGGSLVYKTAPLEGFSGTVGLYTSQNADFWRDDKADVGKTKAGKDTFSRYNVKTSGDYGLTVLGQAYLQYDISETSLIAGRQMFETVYTKSNDTKMIPNTFDGVSVASKDISDTTIQAAYFTAQKLRDHETAHDVIAFDSDWSENDDSAVNKSLTTELVGVDNELIVLEVNNQSIKNLKLKAAYALVPDVLSNFVLEGHYKIPVGDKWSITPGVRYMQQMDELGVTGANGGEGVANRAVDTTGYTNPDSLDTSLWCARIDVKNGPLLARLGWSKVDDKADIVAPWRGFPTGGYTRAMAQYNWDANTETTMVQVDYDFGKANMVKDFIVSARYAMQDFDDTKTGVQADSDILHIDIMKTLATGLEGKIRFAHVEADTGNTTKTDVSYNEYRVELNYFF
jgi:hypothetical protein